MPPFYVLIIELLWFTDVEHIVRHVGQENVN